MCPPWRSPCLSIVFPLLSRLLRRLGERFDRPTQVEAGHHPAPLLGAELSHVGQSAVGPGPVRLYQTHLDTRFAAEGRVRSVQVTRRIYPEQRGSMGVVDASGESLPPAGQCRGRGVAPLAEGVRFGCRQFREVTDAFSALRTMSSVTSATVRATYLTTDKEVARAGRCGSRLPAANSRRAVGRCKTSGPAPLCATIVLPSQVV